MQKETGRDCGPFLFIGCCVEQLYPMILYLQAG